jgi:tRNA threonylcarbamoyladenosine biosynthesis protein TsaE
MKKIVTNSFKETQQLGFDFAKKLKGGEVLALYGDLGSGKTTFMQGLAKGLGITRNIISPTFIIMRSYQVHRHSGKPKVHLESRRENGSWTYPSRHKRQDEGLELKNLYHLDLYRIENESQAVDLGLTEFMGDPQNLVVIEWPDKIENLLPENRINIYFTYLEDDKREIRFD